MTGEVEGESGGTGTRRSKILQATIEQVVLRGISNVRVQDVANSLGLSTGLVHYHFDTKDSLLAQAFEAHGRKSLKAAQEASQHQHTAARRLNVLLGHYGPTGDAAGWRVWIDGWSEALHNGSMRQVIYELDHRWHREVVSALEQAQLEGDLIVGDNHAVARTLLDTIDGLSIRLVVCAAQEGPDAWSMVEVAAQGRINALIDDLWAHSNQTS